MLIPRGAAKAAKQATTLAEAKALEESGGYWTAKHVSAVLGVTPAHLYSIAYLFDRRMKVGKRTVRWNPKDVRLYMMLQRGRRVGGNR